MTGSVQLPGYQVLIGNTDGEPAAAGALVAQPAGDGLPITGADAKLVCS